MNEEIKCGKNHPWDIIAHLPLYIENECRNPSHGAKEYEEWIQEQKQIKHTKDCHDNFLRHLGWRCTCEGEPKEYRPCCEPCGSSKCSNDKRGLCHANGHEPKEECWCKLPGRCVLRSNFFMASCLCTCHDIKELNNS